MGETPLMRAAMQGDLDEVRKRIGECGQRDGSGATALMFAACYGHTQCVRVLIEHEGRLQDSEGKTALMCAVANGHLPCLKLLLCETTLCTTKRTDWAINNLEVRLGAHATALMLAAALGFSDAVEALVPTEAGIQDEYGRTALMTAAESGDLRSVQALVEREGGMRDTFGETALMRASASGNKTCLLPLTDRELRMQDKQGWTALMAAARAGKLECAQLLTTETGLQTSKQWLEIPAGATALMVAARTGHLNIVKLLKDQEAGMIDSDGNMALWYAIQGDDTTIMEYLADEESIAAEKRSTSRAPERSTGSSTRHGSSRRTSSRDSKHIKSPPSSAINGQLSERLANAWERVNRSERKLKNSTDLTSTLTPEKMYLHQSVARSYSLQRPIETPPDVTARSLRTRSLIRSRSPPGTSIERGEAASLMTFTTPQITLDLDADLRKALEAQDSLVDTLQTTLRTKDREIDLMRERLNTLMAQNSTYHAKLASYEDELYKKQQSMVDTTTYQQVLTDSRNKDAIIEALRANLDAKEKQIQTMQNELRTSHSCIAELQSIVTTSTLNQSRSKRDVESQELQARVLELETMLNRIQTDDTKRCIRARGEQQTIRTPRGTASFSGRASPSLLAQPLHITIPEASGLSLQEQAPTSPAHLTALMRAAKHGNQALVRDNISELMQQDSRGWTALMYAAKAGHPGCVQLLLSEGSIENDDERTALDIAEIEHRRASPEHAPRYARCLALLRNRGSGVLQLPSASITATFKEIGAITVEEESDDEPEEKSSVSFLTVGYQPIDSLYTVLRIIGRDSYGDIFEGKDRMNRHFAIKRVFYGSIPPAMQKLFKSEANRLMRLNHEGLLQYKEIRADPDSKSVFFITDVYTETLRDIIQKRKADKQPFTDLEIWSCLAQLSETLRYIHGNKVIVRDLRPENIVFTGNGNSKLLNYGLGHVFDQVSKNYITCDTLQYQAPEVIEGEKKCTDRADLWSLGIIAYELCTLQRPFVSEGVSDLCQLIISKAHAPIAGRPTELCLLIDELLRKTPAKRPKAQNVYRQVEAALHSK
ncbi:Kinase, NEK [Giardia muris]|uniref:Kinase, NEK n=1 Tax=Giardia muris TaxID=5742 RepID=A0A4Z1SYI9_GIAMU|nr:Kinase, NEK [Giardia muris]|eukprot:TNJ28568.1 Kinase, NEK [Giardia muris]